MTEKIKSGIITMKELENTENIVNRENEEIKIGFNRYWISITYNPHHYNAPFGNFHVRAKSVEEAKKIAFKEAMKESKEYFACEEMKF